MELLAPAGGPEAARAAVQNGADAVYLGFGRFNARRNAQNFTPAQLPRPSPTATCGGEGARHRQHPVDRPGAGRAAGEVEVLAAAGADAVIVQDLGAAGAWPPGRPTCRGTPPPR